MVLLICSLFVVFPQELDALSVAEQLRRDGQYFSAEGHYLSLDPLPEQAVTIACALADIAQRTGNPVGKQAFYEELLTQSLGWRDVSLLTLSSLTAARRDFTAFLNYATLWFTEFNHDHPLRYSLMYYLARYTDQDPDELKLGGVDLAWFSACRALAEDKTFARLDNNSLPYWLRYLYLLEEDSEFQIPAAPDGATPEDLFVNNLLRIHAALIRQDYVVAASTINQVMAVRKELDRLDLEIVFNDLLRRFFVARGVAHRAEVVQSNNTRLREWAVLPLLLLPDHRVVHAVPETPVETSVSPSEKTEPAPEEKAESKAVETTVPEQPKAVETTVPEQPKHDVTPPGYEELALRLMAGGKGLEFKIRALASSTNYFKIYKNYLLGLHYLNTGIPGKANEHLSLASRLVKNLPFPLLEMRILLARANYFASQDDLDKANWYRLTAVGIWKAHENIPLFVNRDVTAETTPHQYLIDDVLSRLSEDNAVKRLVYHSELDHFISQRRRAYQRGVLAANPVINDQYQQVGTQLFRLVDGLATDRDNPGPDRYNRTGDFWNRIWKQSLNYYQDPSIPPVNRIQSLLKHNERLLSFVEGMNRFGVVLLSQDQAFALDLGSKRRFLALDDSQRVGFLAGRLGSVWDNKSTLYLSLSPSLRQGGFIDLIKSNMKQPHRLRVLLSLKSFGTSKRTAQQCVEAVLLSSGAAPALGMAESRANWEKFDLEMLGPNGLEKAVSNHDHLLFSGPLKLTERGLSFGNDRETFYFHQILHYNPELCSLTVVSSRRGFWGPVLDELELINPELGFSITLIDESTKLKGVNFLSHKTGLLIP